MGLVPVVLQYGVQYGVKEFSRFLRDLGVQWIVVVESGSVPSLEILRHWWAIQIFATALVTITSTRESKNVKPTNYSKITTHDIGSPQLQRGFLPY